MRIAITVWENRVSPLFDSARTALVVELDRDSARERRYEPLGPEIPISRALKLSQLGVRVLICGAISEFFADLIAAQGIQVIPFVTGNVEEVLEAYIKGSLTRDPFRMPGCGKRRRHRFRGGRGGFRGRWSI
ncbi:MAG: NifB/NifX family molybdenum-iron cluster-binding protein [Candidatus Krumholzibacteriota bacterium]|nr:NifB/NifX family molybdenum-iron cluster-binding protein [Candidatus Krumholzibacteriota bacterium]